MADSKLLNPSNSTSPPPNCAICLGSCSNKCFSDTCMHQFCFKCLLQWSKIKAECPLCKQPFKSIIHNVKSNEEYEEHIVEEPRPIHIIDNEQYLYLPQSPPNPSRHQHRFHFRTTFTVNTHGENAIQQMLLRSWPQYNRRTRRDISTTTSFRRSIYNNNFWASSPVNVSVDGRFREVTPEYFQVNPASRTRLAPWLNRELNALLHENTQDVMQLVDTIMDYLLRYHICSRSFRNLLQTYLGDATDHFVHEFYNFMRSPFDMIGYDRNVVYVERPSSPPLLIDNSEDDNSDVMIVEDTPVVIEVSSTDSDVIMTSFPGEIPKPQILPSSKRSRKRSRHVESSSSSSSSSDREQQRREDRSKRRRKKKAPLDMKNKKSKPFKLADFVMDDSSSSELDDLPLAKYIRIKASIGKKIFKKSSHLAERKISSKKSKIRRSNSSNKDHSKKSKAHVQKFTDLPSTSSTKPHHYRYASTKRNSSCSSLSSSSSSSSEKSVRSRSTLTNSGNVSNRLPSSTPSLLALTKEKKRKSNRSLSPFYSPPSSNTVIDDSRNEKSKASNSNPKHHTSYIEDKHPLEMDNIFSSRYQPSSWPSPSTSGVKDRSNQKSPKRELEPLKLRIKSRVTHNNEQDTSLERPLELINHCRYSPLQVNPYVSIEQDQVVSSPILLTINPNLPRNPVNVSQSINFYNSSTSPDLIDLSISKMKTENILSDVYPCMDNQHSNLNQTVVPPKDAHFNGRHEQIYPSTSTSQPSSSQVNYSNAFVPKSEYKSETSLPEYNVESSNRYWTDFATPNSSLTNSNESLAYNYLSQHPRKSVIQNWSNNRDYCISYNDAISPRWSSSNSPTYPCNTECWSESSD
ncbi:hypothetical protein HHI36_002388 [Cryptolaemus montrouzieri]|uniref:E3 ubiquitin-protein ligase Topors n=1 Tax=Cryptolaemus montrouzieri TaxID=559131 RepID=A0ABD2PAA1_9CUCU